MPSVDARFVVRDLWNQIFAALGTENRMLGTSIFLSREPLLDVFSKQVRAYIADRRREWIEVELLPTDSTAHFVMKFTAPTREPVHFLIEARRLGKQLFSYRAYSVAEGSLRRSTIESFVTASRGFWAPRLSYSFMDDLSPKLREVFRDGQVTMNEFVVNVFESKPNRHYVRQKTVRAWVEREGDREFDLFREMNLQRGRVVTLNGARFSVALDGRPSLLFRCDYTCRAVLSSPAVDDFMKVLDLLEQGAVSQYERYQVRQRVDASKTRTDTGREASYSEYAGTDVLTIRIQNQLDDGWFGALREILSDEDFLAESERMLSFTLVDETNPIVQFRLVDLEAQSSVTVTLDKSQRQVILAPQDLATKEPSVAKIINLIEKATGKPLVIA